MRGRAVAALLSLSVAAVAAQIRETHLNEITAPVAQVVDARVAALAARPSLSASQQNLLAKLQSLQLVLEPKQTSLKGDFAELLAAAKTISRLRPRDESLSSALDSAFALAEQSIEERAAEVEDYANAAALAGPAEGLQADGERVTEIGFAAARTPTRRARNLARADALVRRLLLRASRAELRDPAPSVRLRSGDVVDARGGRVVYPGGRWGTTFDDAWVEIPPGALSTPTRVTLSVDADVVAGRNVADGPALRVEPAGLRVAGAIVRIPTGESGAADAEIGVFSKESPSTQLAGSDVYAGVLTAPISQFSTFQVGVVAPPQGLPGGLYHVIGFQTATSTAADGPTLDANVFDGDLTFGDAPGDTRIVAFGSGVRRTFESSSPFHVSAATPANGDFPNGLDYYQWTSAAPGRFTLSDGYYAGLRGGDGVVSDDGRVIAFVGRGDGVRTLAVGVKGGTGLSAASIAGRWAGVEIGREFVEGAGSFATRTHALLRAFDVDAGGQVAFETSGARFETEIAYRADLADPVHERSAAVVADVGAETWTVDAHGRIRDAAGTRVGFVDAAAGVLVVSFFDQTSGRAEILIAAPQPANSPAPAAGSFRFAGVEFGATAGSPATPTSALDDAPLFGSLDVLSPSAANLSFDATTLTTSTLSGPRSPTGIAWSLVSATTPLAASSTPLALSLDASGTHRVDADPRWIAFGSAGRIALMLSRGEPTRLARGVAIGVR